MTLGTGVCVCVTALEAVMWCHKAQMQAFLFFKW